MGFALLLAVSLAPPPAGAHHSGGVPVVASGGGAGGGWAAIKWSTNGARAFLVVQNESVKPPGHVSAYGYNAATNAYAGGSNVMVVGSMGGAHVQTEPIPGATIEQTVPTVDGPPYGAGIEIRYNDPLDGGTPKAGTYKTLFIAAGAGAGWWWELRGDPGVQLLGIETGTRTYAFSSREFDGAASAQAYVYGAGARANALGAIELTANETLAGLYWPLVASQNRMRMDGPGWGADCLCVISSFTGPTVAGPGPWRFTLTGAGAGASNQADVYLGLADARLPA